MTRYETDARVEDDDVRSEDFYGYCVWRVASADPAND